MPRRDPDFCRKAESRSGRRLTSWSGIRRFWGASCCGVRIGRGLRVASLQRLYAGRGCTAEADLVCHWFVKAGERW